MRVAKEVLSRWRGALAAAVVLAGFLAVAPARAENAAAAKPPTIFVHGVHLIDGGKNVVQLRGVNRAIYESRCTYDANGDADGPFDQTSINAMLAWKINVVRVSLDEDCWLGINGLPKSKDAAGYRADVRAYIRLLRSSGLYVILMPARTAPGTFKSTDIDYMPDADHLPTFWRQIATTFKDDHGIIFDIINEVAMASWNNPDPNPPGKWVCWLNGCVLNSMYGGRFKAAGVQTLVDAIRGTGATQPIILGGIDYNADLTKLLDYLPSDPRGQLLASAHVYDFVEGAEINTMIKDPLEVIAKKMPVIFGELGERHCDSGTAAYTKHLLALIDAESAKGVTMGALGWTWNARTTVSTGWQCPTGPYGDGGPLLIRGYGGTPTVMGAVFRDWFRAKAREKAPAL